MHSLSKAFLSAVFVCTKGHAFAKRYGRRKVYLERKKPSLSEGFSVGNISPVPKVGIEPTHPKIHDFESCASTNSATLACLRQSPNSRVYYIGSVTRP